MCIDMVWKGERQKVGMIDERDPEIAANKLHTQAFSILTRTAAGDFSALKFIRPLLIASLFTAAVEYYHSCDSPSLVI